jgi:hypothetical protein
MNKLLCFFLSFITMYAVDPDEGGGDQSSELDVDTSGGEEGVVEDVGESAWEAIQTEDDGTGEEKPEEPQKAAETQEQIAEAEAAKQAEAEKAAEAAKVITDDDLKPLEGAKQSTQDRFQKITEGYKAATAKVETLTQENQRYKESFDSLRQLGFADEEAANDLVEFSEYRSALASGDATKFTEIINAQLKQFQSLHGKPVQIGGSIISDHPDLQQKVDNLELDENTALEVARARNLQERINRDSQRQVQQTQSAQQSQQLIMSAVNEVEAMEASWRKNDPDFMAVLPELQESIAEIRTKMHPTQWPVAIEMQYKAIKKALAAAAVNRQTTPLRGNGHMSTSRQPTNMQEAVLQEMGMDN